MVGILDAARGRLEANLLEGALGLALSTPAGAGAIDAALGRLSGERRAIATIVCLWLRADEAANAAKAAGTPCDETMLSLAPCHVWAAQTDLTDDDLRRILHTLKTIAVRFRPRVALRAPPVSAREVGLTPQISLASLVLRHIAAPRLQLSFLNAEYTRKATLPIVWMLAAATSALLENGLGARTGLREQACLVWLRETIRLGQLAKNAGDALAEPLLAEAFVQKAWLERHDPMALQSQFESVRTMNPVTLSASSRGKRGILMLLAAGRFTRAEGFSEIATALKSETLRPTDVQTLARESARAATLIGTGLTEPARGQAFTVMKQAELRLKAIGKSPPARAMPSDSAERELALQRSLVAVFDPTEAEPSKAGSEQASEVSDVWLVNSCTAIENNVQDARNVAAVELWLAWRAVVTSTALMEVVAQTKQANPSYAAVARFLRVTLRLLVLPGAPEEGLVAMVPLLRRLSEFADQSTAAEIDKIARILLAWAALRHEVSAAEMLQDATEQEALAALNQWPLEGSRLRAAREALEVFFAAAPS
jgi:hypothetical protein